MPYSSDPSQPQSAPESLRLQKLMEHLGIASRRHSAEIVKAGDVLVNGERILEPGFRVENPETAEITVGGRVYTMAQDAVKKRTVMLNKPAGLICSSSDVHGKTVFACLQGIPERLVCIGRLDLYSDGLLLLSNDGELVNELTHPRYGHSKEYMVSVSGFFNEEVLEFLNAPFEMDGYTTRPAQVEYVERLSTGRRPDGRSFARHLLRFVLREGRNRQIRNMCEQAGLRVLTLTRTAINSLQLPDNLPQGTWRDLTPEDFTQLNTLIPE